MKSFLLLLLTISFHVELIGQQQINIDPKLSSQAKATYSNDVLTVEWPITPTSNGLIEVNMKPESPLFKTLGIQKDGQLKKIGTELNPEFIITKGIRNLKKNGWIIFFDKVPEKPYSSDDLKLNKQSLQVTSSGSRTKITISEVSNKDFTGVIELTLFNSSPLINIAAVVSTQSDSCAFIFDAGLISKENNWKSISWMDTNGQLMNANTLKVGSENLKVKHRTILGNLEQGTLAVFPPPHQYFYPLDEAFNLDFVWHGRNYRDYIPGYGIGIRQDPKGDKRYVPWFNAPPNTQQRMNFFVLLGDHPESVMKDVKQFTHGDRYPELPGYKTMSSHFHNEYIMKVVKAGKPIVEKPEFVEVFNSLGINIAHLGEFHYTAHPKGPDSLRLDELKSLYDQCERLSDDQFLMLPGEEPNVYLGGHWMQLFPRPVYWIMDRPAGIPYLQNVKGYGKVYHIGSTDDMFHLLQDEDGLAWTAHPRIKNSIEYPDTYKKEPFYLSNQFLGGAWKQMPGDLSHDRLGTRVLDLLDEMSNWGQPKRVIAEADLFSITKENEMWANLNTNYLMLDKLPNFSDGWSEVLDAMTNGKFFSTTGEILIPQWSVNGARPGNTAQVNGKNDKIDFELRWTFPLQYAEIISGDGEKVFRKHINLDHTTAFGKQLFSEQIDLKGKRWVRLEVWDAAVNGAFTQTIWLEGK